jgi:hypothetical protein
MNLDQQSLQTVKKKFLARFPNFTSFPDDAKYADWERGYKVELVEYYRQTVAPLLIPLPTAGETQAEAGEKVISLFTHKLAKNNNKPQNLVGWRYYEFTSKLDQDRKAHFALLVSKLIDDQSPQDLRISDFIAGLSALHQTLGMKLHDAATRSLTTFFLFLHDPTNHIFIKTQQISQALKLLTGEALAVGPLTAETYAGVQDVARQLFSALEDEGWQPQDLIDVQSFLWSITMENEKPERSFEIVLTDGAIKNGYVGAGKPDEFFPKRYFGGNTDAEAGEYFKLVFEDGSSLETDIKGEGNTGRIRARFYTVFNKLNPKVGDIAEIRTLDKDTYQFLLKRTDHSEQIMGNENTHTQHPLNQILYGPPGTGKTYHTTRVAVAICDGDAPTDRDELLERYQELRKENRIHFVTFHQSFGYEDFIEGIRPEMEIIGDEGIEQLTYRIQNGIFKRACQLAKEGLEQTSRPGERLNNLDNRKFAKMSVGGLYDPDVEEFCFEQGYIALGWASDTDFSSLPKQKKWEKARDAIKNTLQASGSDSAEKRFAVQAVYFFKNWLDIGDIVIVPRGLSQIQAIGVIEGEYEYRPDLFTIPNVRKVKWLLRDAEIPVEKLQDKRFSQQTIYKLNRDKLNLDYLTKLLTEDTAEASTPENHVLIIDEINRGNISKVFGELITLLEPSKRWGADDEVTLKLPYSGDNFSVPANLHVVGTMNTADRSIALLDTALRRRFQFKEMLPESGIIPGVQDGKIPDAEDDEINLRELLDALNARIEYLLGPDQTLGHAYFINITSFAELANVFRNQIIPLLQEYFHEDWKLIQMVLSDAFIVSTVSDPSQLFSHVDGWDGVIPDEKQHYRIPDTFTPAMFRALYSA